MQQMIPLSSLRVSPGNVRKTGGIPIYKLANSIHAHGLLQNLVVTKAGDGYQVDAGGRRLQALQELAKVGKIPGDFMVPCQIVEAGTTAHEASLAENVARESMHPVDEFAAFKQLADEGQSPATIAERFGTTERHIAQRLKLANVAPKILAQYRDGKASLEQMQVLALVDDHARQEAAWGKTEGWQRHVHHLRDALTRGEVPLKSSLGQFVGIEAYEAAGGVVRRDLFGSDEAAYLPDAALVTKVATAKLEKKADAIRKAGGWLWVETRLDFDYAERSTFSRSDSKAIAGVIVHIGYGKIETITGLVRREDMAKSRGAGKVTASGKAAKSKKPGELSFAAVQRLQAEATAIVQAEVADSPRTALALLVTQLAGPALYDHRHGGRKWVYISRDHSGRVHGPHREQLEVSTGALKLAATEKAWRDKMPKKADQLREWALAQEFTVLGRLLAFLVAREVEAIDGTPNAGEGIVALAAAAQVDLAKTWKPTAEWLATLPKSVVLEQLRDAGVGKIGLAQLAKMKTGQVQEKALGLFPDGWLPKPLRAPEKARKAKPATGKAAAAGDA